MTIYEYSHGGNIYDADGLITNGVLDFSANVNPLGIDEAVKLAAKSSIDNCHIYPDSQCRKLTSRISQLEDVPSSFIFCSNGASDILFRLVFSIKPKKILVTAPSFADYQRAGEAVGAHVDYYILKKEKDFIIDEDIIKQILDCSPNIVFICNPNNPTASITNINMMTSIAKACSDVGATLLVDECFLDFVERSREYTAKAFVYKYKNVVILKAFTKIFALAGLRLGYALCSDEALINRLRLCGADWSVSSVAQEAGIVALNNAKKYIEDSILYVKKQRELIIASFKNMGLTVYPSYANFIFFHCHLNIDLYKELERKGVIIRSCKNFPHVGNGYYRVAVLTEEKNQILINALEEVLNRKN